MTNLNPTQLHEDLVNSIRFDALSWGLSAMSGLAIVLASSLDTRPAKTAGLALAAGLAIGGRQANNGAMRTGARRRDVENISNTAQTQVLWDNMTDPDKLAAAKAATQFWHPEVVFDLRKLATEPEKFPHVMVIGGTGDGKSTLVEWIIDQERQARRLYISPTRDDVEFINYEVFGTGFRHDGSQYALEYAEISHVLQWLVNECKIRYDLNAQQSRDRGFVNAVLDEYRLTSKIGKDLDGTDTVQIINPASGQPMSYGEAVSYLVTVARKRFIRLWLLLQSETVKAVGMEGEGDIRESLVKLRLGSFARAHLAKLVSQGRYPQEALIWFDNQPPRQVCMVDDAISMVPHLLGYQDTKAQAVGYKPPIPTNVVMEMPLRGNTPIMLAQSLSPDAVQDSTLPDEGEPVVTVPPLDTSTPDCNEVSPASCVGSETSSPEISQKFSVDLFRTMDALVKEEGLKKTEVLKRVKLVGDKYTQGKLAWEAYLAWRVANK